METSPQHLSTQPSADNSSVAEREKDYRSLFNSIDQGFCIIEMLYDSKRIAIDYRFLEVNTLFEQQTGLDSVAGQLASQLLPNPGLNWLEIYTRVAATGTTAHFEYDNRLTGRCLDVHASRIGGNGSSRLAVLFSDITDRKQVEETLRSTEERFRFMAESMPQKIFTVMPDGVFTYFNPQWQIYTGVSVSKLLNREVARRSIVHEDDLVKVTEIWQSSFEGKSPAEYEFRMRRNDGEYRWHIGRMNPMRNQAGIITMWVGSVTDVDDIRGATQRRYELEIEAATLTEQRAQLMALNQAKDEFISLASHQLRTPATGVKQYLGMMLEGYAGELSAEQIAFLETAYESNERQINIVNDLLQVARIDAGKVVLRREAADILRLVKNVINEHSSRFLERQQTIVLRASEEAVMAGVDADRIRMVLDNIIDNASKYTHDGKRITVTIKSKPDAVQVAITDQGVGMDSDDVNRIFQKFSRLENPLANGVEGSGLGLYWAKKIIDLHQGTIKVNSTLGKGTTFTIVLPA